MGCLPILIALFSVGVKIEFCMRGAGALERIKTLGADYMLNAAGVLHSGFWVYPQAGKPAGKKGVALIHTLGNLLPRGQQRDVPLSSISI